MSEIKGKVLTNSNMHENLTELYDVISPQHIPDKLWIYSPWNTENNLSSN